MVFFSNLQKSADAAVEVDESIISSEEDPLLPRSNDETQDVAETWIRPAAFWWIEVAIFSNVFLSGFDGTVTASTYAVISSEFMSSNLASWITTSYLVTSTALQPLYGRFSDIVGRRICLFIATTLFGVGCLGCALSPDLVTLDIMRAVTGIGGGGLMTMGE
jgi:MFS family permease